MTALPCVTGNSDDSNDKRAVVTALPCVTGNSDDSNDKRAVGDCLKGGTASHV